MIGDYYTELLMLMLYWEINHMLQFSCRPK